MPRNNILVSHESPVDLLEESLQYNDFDYCLTHLLEENETYRNFFKKSCANPNREVLFDTSIYELGYVYPKYVEVIKEYKPTCYVVPDLLSDYKGTINYWEEFTNENKDLEGRKIGVVQGASFSELIDCYKFMSRKADQIAINFAQQSFENICKETLSHEIVENAMSWSDNPTLVYWTLGRQAFIKYLVKHDIWNYHKPHHLLGNALPMEMIEYAYNDSYPYNIRSVDTSNPIVAGLDEIYYDPAIGLKHKPKSYLFERINEKVTSSQREAIIHNLRVYKQFLNR